VVFPDHPDEDAYLERVKAAIKRIGQAHAARCHISLYLAWHHCATVYGVEAGPTKGALLGLVRVAWGSDVRVVIQLTAAGGWRPCAYRLFGEAWSRTDVAKWFCKSYDTELEALTVALEKTP